mmetsp:Transcript_43733/g.109139  ORF Transcript_43733/g.109139 Transcript_43733/m.109139 type:complete len:234 (+) Transcript_43733:1926-2627(+)
MSLSHCVMVYHQSKDDGESQTRSSCPTCTGPGSEETHPHQQQTASTPQQLNPSNQTQAVEYNGCVGLLYVCLCICWRNIGGRLFSSSATQTSTHRYTYIYQRPSIGPRGRSNPLHQHMPAYSPHLCVRMPIEPQQHRQTTITAAVVAIICREQLRWTMHRLGPLMRTTAVTASIWWISFASSSSRPNWRPCRKSIRHVHTQSHTHVMSAPLHLVCAVHSRAGVCACVVCVPAR